MMNRITFNGLTANFLGLSQQADYLLAGARDKRTPADMLSQHTFHSEVEWQAANWLRASHLRDFCAAVLAILSDACEELHAADASEAEWDARAVQIAIDLTHCWQDEAMENGTRYGDPIRDESARQRRAACNEALKALGILGRHRALTRDDLAAIVAGRHQRADEQAARRAKMATQITLAKHRTGYRATLLNDAGDVLRAYSDIDAPNKGAARAVLACRMEGDGIEFTTYALERA